MTLRRNKSQIEEMANEITNNICYDEKITDDEGYFKEDLVFEVIKKTLNKYL